MKITKRNALCLWERCFGSSEYAEDFHGNFMCKRGYGDPNFYIWDRGVRIYCGWNLHHILPLALGGTNAISNLICTNIVTNQTAADKNTYWIDDCLYQVQRDFGNTYTIVRLR